MKFIPPKENQRAFSCPHCGVFSEQIWSYNIHCYYDQQLANGVSQSTSFKLKQTGIVNCHNCEQVSIWIASKMVYPATGNVEMANPDLPEDIKNDYNEAKNIVNPSPRGAAALLRLAIQKLCMQLGEKEKI